MDSTDTASTSLDIGASRLGYRATGAGPDLLMIHGWPLNRETWRNVATKLSDFRCHLIDLPGCGDSVTPAEVEVSLRDHIEAVTEVIDRLGLASVTLVGQDSGGLIARAAAVQRANVVNALVLCGTEIPGRHPAFIDRLQIAMKAPGAKTMARKLLRIPKAARSAQLLGGLFSNRDLIEGSFRTEVLERSIADKNVYQRQIEILHSYRSEIVDTLADIHPRIECPTLLVWGEHDPFFPVDAARTMADEFGGPVRFEVIADARLLAYEEHPERFAELTRTFLQHHGIKRAASQATAPAPGYQSVAGA